MTNRYEEASKDARKLLENFDEIDLAEMLASSNATAATINARIAELEAELARVQQRACRTAENLRHAEAEREQLRTLARTHWDTIERVKDVAADMRGITGARYLADALDKALVLQPTTTEATT